MVNEDGFVSKQNFMDMENVKAEEESHDNDDEEDEDFAVFDDKFSYTDSNNDELINERVGGYRQ